MNRLTRDGLPNPSRETKFLCVNGDREKLFSPVQLTTSGIGNLTYPVDPYSCYLCDHYHIISHQASYKLTRQETRFSFG